MCVDLSHRPFISNKQTCEARQGHLGFVGKDGSSLDFLYVRQGHLGFVRERQDLPGFVTPARDTWALRESVAAPRTLCNAPGTPGCCARVRPLQAL